MAFDTLTYAKKLQEAGVPPQQAETHAWALKETVEDTLATKQDLQLVRQDVQLVQQDMREMKETVEDTLATKQDLQLVRQDVQLVRQEVRELETRMDGRFTELETRIDGRFKEVDGRFRLLYWMVGFNLTLTLFTFSLTVGVLLKLLAG